MSNPEIGDLLNAHYLLAGSIRCVAITRFERERVLAKPTSNLAAYSARPAQS